MEATEYVAAGAARWEPRQQLVPELASLSAHLNSATARWLELALEVQRQGGAGWDDFGCWLAWRCGIPTREAREYLRVAEALEELPALRAAFQRGELSYYKLRALTRDGGAAGACVARLSPAAGRAGAREP